MIRIDDRLKAICSMVERCSVFADIGSDHAYVPISLLLENVIDYAIISDVNRGPVETARKNVRRYSLEDRTEFIIGSGFEKIDTGRVDCAAVCGMGGELIRDILKNSIDKVRKIGCLVLQPMNSQDVVRRFLHENSFTITGEDIVRDGNHFYSIIRAVPVADERQYDEIFYEIGHYPYEHGNERYVDYLNHLIKKNTTIIENCRGRDSKKAAIAMQAALRKIQLITGVKEIYESKRSDQVH